MTEALILEIIISVLKYGPTAIISIANAMQEKEITVEDVRALFIDKDPEEFFK
jgi:hypothetical protein